MSMLNVYSSWCFNEYADKDPFSSLRWLCQWRLSLNCFGGLRSKALSHMCVYIYIIIVRKLIVCEMWSVSWRRTCPFWCWWRPRVLAMRRRWRSMHRYVPSISKPRLLPPPATCQHVYCTLISAPSSTQLLSSLIYHCFRSFYCVRW